VRAFDSAVQPVEPHQDDLIRIALPERRVREAITDAALTEQRSSSASAHRVFPELPDSQVPPAPFSTPCVTMRSPGWVSENLARWRYAPQGAT